MVRASEVSADGIFPPTGSMPGVGTAVFATSYLNLLARAYLT